MIGAENILPSFVYIRPVFIMKRHQHTNEEDPCPYVVYPVRDKMQPGERNDKKEKREKNKKGDNKNYYCMN